VTGPSGRLHFPWENSENFNVSNLGDFSSKRRYPRRLYKKPVGILYQGRFWQATGEEIGEGGIGILSPENIPEGAQVILSLFVPGGEMAVVRSTVRHNVKANTGDQVPLGLQFVDFAFKYKKKIRDYIAAKTEAEAGNEWDQASPAAEAA
jgi:hypothetical protein